jgi:hypothetical protein
VIELMLQAERDLSVGLVDQAERLYRQVADADPHNSIAVVGLARVALERADDAGALRLARRALAIDAENVAALRLVARLEEVMTWRGEALPAGDAPVPGPTNAPGPAKAATDPAPAPPSAAPPGTPPSAPNHPPAAAQPTGLGRLLRRKRP